MTFEEAKELIMQADKGIVQWVRKIASQNLQEQGCEEIGSSDVSCRAIELVRRCGSVEDVIREYIAEQSYVLSRD